MKNAVLLFATFVACQGPWAAAAEVARQPNFVFILCDDLGYGDVRAFNPDHGKIPTPNIDRLASEAMMFTDAHTSSAVCTPSRYSILTGRYCWRSRLQSGVLGGEGKPLIERGRMTIAAFLKEQGYATACLGKWHLGLEFGPKKFASPLKDGPLNHGFNRFFGISASLDMPPFAWIDDDRFPEQPSVTKAWVRPGPAAPSFEAVDVLPTLTDKAVQYIGERGRSDKPFFLYLPLTAPHTPIVPTRQWQGKSGLGDYADFVMQTDACVGEVLQAIDDAGQRENTVVFFTSDNGFAPAAGLQPLEGQGHYPSAAYRGYKADIWEGGHRVPLIVRWPQVVTPGSTSDQLVGLIDFFATAAAIVGQAIPDGAAEDSFSLLPILEGHDAPVRTAEIHHSIDGYFAIRQGKWKLELCAGSGGWGSPREPQAAKRGLPPVQLYDLDADPSEQHNLAADHPEVVERLTRLLEESVANGRSTPGQPQRNDAEIEIYKRPAGR